MDGNGRLCHGAGVRSRWCCSPPWRRRRDRPRPHGLPIVAGRGQRGANAGASTSSSASLWFVSMVGLVASATHLGNPANALYVFVGVGRSPLSTEVFCAVVFLALAGVYWLYSFAERPRRGLQRGWMGALIVASGAFVTSVAFAYAADTIVSWDTWHVPANLWLNALVGGPLLALLGLRLARFAPQTACSGACSWEWRSWR